MDLLIPLIADDGDPVEIEHPFISDFPMYQSHSIRRKLMISSIICACLTIISCTGGLLAQSVSILIDSVYMLSKFTHYLVGVISISMSTKSAGSTKTFGLQRAEVMGQLLCVFVIWCFNGYLTYLAVYRIIWPWQSKGLMMSITAGITLAGCIGVDIFLLIRRQDEEIETPPIFLQDLFNRESENLTFKDIFVHSVGDIVRCIFLIMTGVVIYISPGLAMVDSIVAFAFSLLIMFHTSPQFKDWMNILMEASPPNQNTQRIINDLLRIQGVSNVHSVHLWSISLDKTVFSCHIKWTDPEYAIKIASQIIKYRYKVTYPTIQVEKIEEMEELPYRGRNRDNLNN